MLNALIKIGGKTCLTTATNADSVKAAANTSATLAANKPVKPATVNQAANCAAPASVIQAGKTITATTVTTKRRKKRAKRAKQTGSPSNGPRASEFDLIFDFYLPTEDHIGTGLFDSEYLDLHHVTFAMRFETFEIIERLIGNGLYEGQVNGVAWVERL